MTQTIPIRRPDDARPPPVDVVEMVWTCKTERITAPDKRAYEFLFKETQGGRLRILTTSSAIGWNQGTSGDAGRDRLKKLAAVGLIDYKPGQKRGCYEVSLLEPFSALRALGAQDPQLDLPFENTAGEQPSKTQDGHPECVPRSPAGITDSLGRSVWPPQARAPDEEPPHLAEVPPEDPRQLAEVPPLAPPSRKPSINSVVLYQPLTISEPSNHSGNGKPPLALAGEEARRGTSGGSSAEIDLVAEVNRRREWEGLPKQIDSIDVTRVASIAASMARIPSPRELQARRDHWKHVITSRVKDPALLDCVIDKVTCAVVAGDLEESELLQILSRIDKHRREGTLRGPAGKYFFFSVRACFDQRGLKWAGYQKPKPR